MTRLMDDMFSNYRTEIRPTKKWEDSVVVNVSFYILTVHDVDELAGSLILSGGINVMWTDIRLMWQPDSYGGIPSIMVNSSKVWTPKIFQFSSTADIERLSMNDFDIRINNHGVMLVSPGKVFKCSCVVDMTNFPTDSQTCHMSLIAWGYYTKEIKLSYLDPSFDLGFLSPNGEWNVDSISPGKFPEHENGTSALVYTIILTRRSAYFMMSMAVPVYILCFLHPFVFLLPAASGERISYSITMFLSLAVYMTIVSDSMPKVSEPMAGISYFLLVAMLLSCVLIILTIFSLRWDAVTDTKQFPKWLKIIVLRLKKKEKKIFCNKSLAHKNSIANNSSSNMSEEPDVNIASEDKGNHFVNEKTDLQKKDVVDFIDNALFVTTEIVVTGLISGFAIRFYR
ncbi:acetylcholine receptor subunit alpha-like [Ylistrum balloti]|uniref:acetylcholine receptor subunit alpha-like n=1 Tax=Ylistrum balloti TaxID=509963 RepID=UPI002905BFCA|nr:acetylcholine receptor subunit alpha-like [Ylistrum balloti]